MDSEIEVSIRDYAARLWEGFCLYSQDHIYEHEFGWDPSLGFDDEEEPIELDWDELTGEVRAWGDA